jgi:hypothetical protein
MFRDGLLIALLAYCPIRLKNFAALEIGRSFVNAMENGGSYLLPPKLKKRERTSGRLPMNLQGQ